jgi:hypothetical protein
VLTIRRAAIVLGGAVAAIGLVACDTDQIGAAAVIDGERITVSQLQDEVRSFHELAGTEPTGDQTDLQRQYLNSAISHRIVEEVGQDVGVSVSEAEIDQFIADEFSALNPEGDIRQLMVDNQLTEEGFRQIIHDNIMFTKIAEAVGGEGPAGEQYEAVAEEMEIEINPRYGSWDGLALQAISGSISESATQ